MLNLAKTIILLWILALVGCSPAGTPPNPSQTAEPTLVAQTPTATFLPATPTPTDTMTDSPVPPAITPTPDPESKVHFQPLSFLEGFPSGTVIKGAFVFTYPYLTGPNQILLMNMETGSQYTLLPGGHAADVVFQSPDRKWLAYDEAKGEPGVNYVLYPDQIPPFWQDRFIVVVDADGKEHSRIAYRKGWGVLSPWLTNATLIIRREEAYPGTATTARWILNPFTGDRFELPPNPKDLSIFSSFLIWWGIGITSYNPALTREVYLSDLGTVLVDLSSRRELARIDAFADSPPEWSPDGRQFVIVCSTVTEPERSKGELFIVNSQGDINQLTHLTISNYHITPLNYRWSPSGQKLAFWVALATRKNIADVNIAILDIPTGGVTVYPIESTFNLAPEPVWSPDGSQLLVGVTSETGERTLLVDLSQNWAVQVGNQMIPAGWLVH